MHRVSKIVSGGQTGADRAGLDWAIENGIPHGGWCPKGRKAEDGPIPDCYFLKETTRADYLQRTEANVKDSDATVIFTMRAELTGGSKRTADFAQKHKKPWIHLSGADGVERCVQRLEDFIARNNTDTLNVAGSRGSKEARVAELVRSVLDRALSKT